jgi:hypothetical protein
MHQLSQTQGQESPSGDSARTLVWVEGQVVVGWGCSECAWAFAPFIPPDVKTLDEMLRNLQAQLYEEFASHDCAEHLRIKEVRVGS